MVRPSQSEERKERHTGRPATSVRQHPKKEGGGGRFTMGKLGEYDGGATVDRSDPNYDPDEMRVSPDDGITYKYEDIYKFYKCKYTAQEIAEYWEYECTPPRPRYRVKAIEEKPAGPSLAESAARAKVKAKAPAKAQTAAKRLTEEELETDGPVAQDVAAAILCHPSTKVGKFYDVHGLLGHPNLLNSVSAVIAKRLRNIGITKLVVFGARGLLFTPLCIKLNLPLLMICKKGEIPSDVQVESAGEGKADDAYCVQKGSVQKGDKAVLLDDYIDTGATFCAGIALLKKCGAEVIDCTCILELQAVSGRTSCLKAGAKTVWSFLSEDLLKQKAA